MRRVCAWGLAVALCFMAGCSEPPTKEHDQAVSSIAAARAAGAATYSADELAAADASLKRYDALVAQRDYKQALSSALDARDRGFEAAKAATTKQTELRKEAGQLLAGLDAALLVADTRLKTTRTAANARRLDRLRQTRKSTPAAMQDARTLLDGGDLTKAVKNLVAATGALKRDIAALDPPAKPAKK